MVKSTEYIPQRGDVVWINFNPQGPGCGVVDIQAIIADADEVG